jgi:hypothetical protein
MSLAELTEASTTEEVQSYVEQVVEEVAADRAGTEEKGDARIAAEHADNEHKPAKANEIPAEKSGSKPADKAVPAKAEESGDEESSTAEWLDEDLKAEVAAYGIEESELADFASREELERAMRLFDKSALAAGRKALEESDSGRNEKGQFVKKAEPKAEPKAEAKAEVTDGKYEPKLDKAVYDEEIVNEFTRMRDHYESKREELETRFKALEERFLESDARAEESHFDSLVDSLDHPDLFGKTDKEDAKQLQRRTDLMIAVKAHRIGMEKLGRPAELNQSLVGRVARMVFAEDLGKKDLKTRTRKISRQSNGRQGGGATRPSDPREDPRDEFDRLYKELARS